MPRTARSPAQKAARKIADSTGNPVGAPTAYRPEYARIAAKLCRIGATNAELGEELGVNADTICRWQRMFPAFARAVKTNNGAFDNRIVRSLAERALGWKDQPPDTGAAIWWTKARLGWRESRDDTRATVVVNIAQAVVNVQSGAPTGVLNAGVLEGEASEVAAEPALIAKAK